VLANNNFCSPTICVDHTNTTFSNSTQSDFNTSSLSYEEIQPGNLSSWKGYTWPISIFGKHSTQDIINNIKISLARISDFITNCHIKNNRKGDIPCLEEFGQIIFEFVTFIFKGGWDTLKAGSGNKSFCNMTKEEFTTKVSTKPLRKKSDRFSLSKPVEFTNIPLPQVPPRLSKKDMAKSKFHSKKSSNKPANKPTHT